MEKILSLNTPLSVDAFGFSMADEVAQMISWLGRGTDFRRFITNDVEGELYAQTPGAQLMSITCKEAPRLKISGTQNDRSKSMVVMGVSVIFSLALRIKMADGVLWYLDVEHNYDAVNIHMNDGRRSLTQNFTVVAHRQESVAN